MAGSLIINRTDFDAHNLDLNDLKGEKINDSNFSGTTLKTGHVIKDLTDAVKHAYKTTPLVHKAIFIAAVVLPFLTATYILGSIGGLGILSYSIEHIMLQAGLLSLPLSLFTVFVFLHPLLKRHQIQQVIDTWNTTYHTELERLRLWKTQILEPKLTPVLQHSNDVDVNASNTNNQTTQDPDQLAKTQLETYGRLITYFGSQKGVIPIACFKLTFERLNPEILDQFYKNIHVVRIV